MATLTPTVILQQTMEAFKARVPQLQLFSTNFSSQRVKKGQTLTGHIRAVPTVGDYGSTSGYFENGQEGESLLTDVPVTASAHKHCTVSLTHLNAISDEKRTEFLGDQAYAMGKSVVDAALALVLATNFSESTTETIANTDADTLRKVRTAMGKKKANLDNLNGIVNIDFAAALDADARIASRDYKGAMLEAGPVGVFRGVQGFREIYEYADLGANGENLSGFFFDPRAVVVATGLPSDSTDLAASLGIPAIASTEVLTDPSSGLSMLGIMHMAPGKLDIYMSIALVYGVAAGKQTGSSGTICDYAGHRVKTA
jgi:hypothetical protein